MAQHAPTPLEEQDDLDAYVAEQTAHNPAFAALVAEAARRKQLLKALIAAREAAGLSRREVAARLATSPAAVGRLEHGGPLAALAALQRYAAVNKRLEWRLGDAAAVGPSGPPEG